MGYDFSGYATKNDLLCSDGRTIRANAFAGQDGEKVPLVWRHRHDDIEDVIGHAVLENRADGVYAYGSFNNSRKATEVKERVRHGDITALSIFANQLIQDGADVKHGVIREVSLVMAGANPGAQIDNYSFKHGDEFDEVESSGIIYTGLSLEHEEPPAKEKEPMADDKKSDSSSDGKTVEDVFNTLNDEQKNLLYYMVGTAAASDSGDGEASHEDSDEGETSDSSDDGESDDTPEEESNEDTINHEDEDTNMSRRVFEDQGDVSEKNTLTHDQFKSLMDEAIANKASFKDTILAHAGEYGITNIGELFPDAKKIRNTPDFVSRRMEWVNSVLSGTSHSPFSRIKSMSADITFDTARAKGYVKGSLKQEEFFALKKRTTSPTTIYKKQKLDRDDILDITDFDVVAWIRSEMRLMLNEEIARAILFGDGRAVDDADKIKDPAGAADGIGIRSIANDDNFYAHHIELSVEDAADPSKIEDTVLRARPIYKGTGAPTFFTTEKYLTDLLLQKDTMGRRLYKTVDEVAAALRVSNIVTVEAMEAYPKLLGIEVNLADYTIGADRGGEINSFDDFDIDYNQYKYLLETRISGALTLPKSALVFTVSSAVG